MIWLSVHHFRKIRFSKTVRRRFSVIKLLPKNFTKLTEKYVCRRLFFNKVVGCRLKKGSGAGVLQWILRNIQERLFIRTSKNCCFWYLEISLQRGISCKVQHFGTHSFQINFRVLHLSGVFRTISKIQNEAFWQKGHDNQSFKEFSLSETLLSITWLKPLLFTRLRDCFLYNSFFNFSLLEQSTNTLKLKASQ